MKNLTFARICGKMNDFLVLLLFFVYKTMYKCHRNIRNVTLETFVFHDKVEDLFHILRCFYVM